ncbi:MAG: flagellar basal body rod protein FlgB [Deltaproteobacteria bacterium]|nr:flagellar basal body rod protein FlgB [Deltaproteobacteria bacterium]
MTTIFGGIGELTRALDFHMNRQNMISANIANVDTPGYAPRELSRSDNAGGASFSLTLATTDTKHIHAAGSGSESGVQVFEEHDVVPGNDLNYVSLDKEMARLTVNTIRFQTVGRLVSKQMGMLRYAARDARG